MNSRQGVHWLAFAASVANAALTVGHTHVVAQSGTVQLVRICPRGSAECGPLVGRSINVGHAQTGQTLTIPQGCGLVSRAGAQTLSGYTASIPGGSNAPAMSMTAYPRYENPKAGDRITITNDAQHCCLNAEGDKIVDCQFQPGEKIVKVMLGPLG
jgi:hypothetical protein